MGDEYEELLAEAARYASKNDLRKAARALREAIALKPDRPEAYSNLGATLSNSGLCVESAQRFLEAMERSSACRGTYAERMEQWAMAAAGAFHKLTTKACDEVAKPEWWNDEALKVLSARVVKRSPDNVSSIRMRGLVLSGRMSNAWEAGPRSAAELKEAAAHFERAMAMEPAPALWADHAGNAEWCRSQAEDIPPGGKVMFCSNAQWASWHKCAAAADSTPAEPSSTVTTAEPSASEPTATVAAAKCSAPEPSAAAAAAGCVLV